MVAVAILFFSAEYEDWIEQHQLDFVLFAW